MCSFNQSGLFSWCVFKSAERLLTLFPFSLKKLQQPGDFIKGVRKVILLKFIEFIEICSSREVALYIYIKKSPVTFTVAFLC